MKINTKHYAKLLYEITDKKSELEIKSAVEKFARILMERKEAGQLKKIIEDFEAIYKKEKGIVEAEITSARVLDDEMIGILNSYIAKLSNAKEISFERKIDKNLLGGVIIRCGDKILDGSLRANLNAMKEIMVK